MEPEQFFAETFIDLTSFDDEKLKLLCIHLLRQLDLPDILYMKKIMKKMVDIFKKT